MQPQNCPTWWPEHLDVSAETVEVSDLHENLQIFLPLAAALHFEMFSTHLTVTSGHDAVHGTGSKHYMWKAVDIRSKDLTREEADRFAVALVRLQGICSVGIFDERFIGEQHWHVECA